MEMTLVEKLEGMRKFTIEHYNPMAASGAITVIDELIHWHKKQAGINKLLAASGHHNISIEEVIETLDLAQCELRAMYKRLNYLGSNVLSKVDAVHEALKAACASGAVAKGMSAVCKCDKPQPILKFGQYECQNCELRY